MTRVLIIGIDGQDGAYLAKSLVNRNDVVYGTYYMHNVLEQNFTYLGIKNAAIQTRMFALPGEENNWESLFQWAQPEEVYLLAGLSSVADSFRLPTLAISYNLCSLSLLLEHIRKKSARTKLFYAGSVECYGQMPGNELVNESTPFNPASSPYAISKASAIELIRLYRKAYSLNVCAGILGNHESPLRPPSFVTRKIIDSADAIAEGKLDKLKLGNLHVQRDWGWAEEYVEAYPLMLRRDTLDDYIIATGETRKLEDFVDLVFKKKGIGDWQDWVEFNNSLKRPQDIESIRVSPSRINAELGWHATIGFEKVIDLLLEQPHP